MKLQSLAIIFIIIILPITMVLSDYIDNKITTARLELEYDTKLLNASFDAIKSYQLSDTSNSFKDIATTKVKNIEASASAFYTSLTTNYNYTGYKSSVMNEYVPAVVFTLYDGYYIYAPYTNTLTSTLDSSGNPELNSETVDEKYKDGESLYGLKSYVYYSCRYTRSNGDDFVITYTLDNYITVQGIINNNYVNKYGYLIKGIVPSGENYIYDGITFSKSNKEQLTEAFPVYDEVNNVEIYATYNYVTINGVKYYLEQDDVSNPSNSKIFYVDASGTKNYSQFNGTNLELYRAIKENISAYEYYKNAYEFTKWVNENLSGLSASQAVDSNGNSITDLGNDAIFGNDIDYESLASSFNRHRQNVIRHVVETNLAISISAFSTKANASFIMPKKSEDKWNLIENNICIIGFLQGLNVGAKIYNGYAVVANSLSKEYVDENDIYILTNSSTYCKANDETIKDGNSIKTGLSFKPGMLKSDFEQKKYIDTKNPSGATFYYYPTRK